MEKYKIPEMWDYLTDMEKYNQELPIYVEKPFSQNQIERLEAIIDEKLSVSAEQFLMPGGQEEYRGKDWFDPKKVTHMSREMVEFIAPEDVEKTMSIFLIDNDCHNTRRCRFDIIAFDGARRSARVKWLKGAFNAVE